MQNTPKNTVLYQGALPPPNPVQGDIWLDDFGTAHVWQGYYWVKVQGPTMETPSDSIIIGNYNNQPVHYGFIPPPHGDKNIYWLSNPKIEGGSELYESVPKVTGNNAAVQAIFKSIFKERTWKKVTDSRIFEEIEALLDTAHLQTMAEEDVPEVSLTDSKTCSPEEAAEKLKAFEEAVDLTGRLDTDQQKQMRELIEHEADFFANLEKVKSFFGKNLINIEEAKELKYWHAKQPEYKVIPPRPIPEKGLIDQIDLSSTYKNLTTEDIIKFIEDLKHKP